MSFLARLFINDRIINVQSSRIHFSQNKDIAGKPAGRVNGGLFTLVLEMDGQTDLLHQMMAIDQMVDGYVRFYKRDGMSKLVDYEFKDTYIYRYRMTQTANGTNPALIEVSFSPGALQIGYVVYRKPWSDAEFNVVEAEPTPAPEQEPKILEFYLTDTNNKRIENVTIGSEVYLNIRTHYMVGEKITVDLTNDEIDYMYENQKLENDTLSEYIIESDHDRLLLEVVAQENN